MSYTKRTVILSVVVSLLLASVMLFCILRWWAPAAERSAQAAYVLGVWDGQVAVFEGGQSYPMQIFDVFVSTLPPEEQEKISRGIPVQSADELSVLLEDYTS